MAVVLGLAPVPLGSNRPLAWTALAVILGLLLLVRGAGPLPPVVRPVVRAVSAGWLAVVAWALVQAVPWTPAAWHHPLWAEAGGVGAIAVDPALAVEGAMRLLSYGAAFLLAAGAAREAEGARRLVAALAVASGLIAAYGLVVHLGGFGTILAWDKWTYADSLTATYVNRNAAATLFGFGLLCALALLLRRRASRWPWGVVAVAGPALLLTQSRAGLAAAVLGGVVLAGAMAAIRRPSARRLGRGIMVAGGLAVVLAVAAGQGVAARLAATDLGDTDRAPVHAAVAAAIAERPWTGHGLGGFNRAFAAHRPADLDQHWDKAHSSPLENAFELGLPATVLFHAVLAGLAATCVAGLVRRRRHRVYPALGLAALILAGAHALVDFTLQMPANAMWLAALAGIGVAQSRPTRRATSSSAAPSSARR